MPEPNVEPETPRRRPKGRKTLWLLATASVFVAVAGGFWWYRQRAPRHFARAVKALEAKRLDEVERELAALDGRVDYEPHRHFLRGALLLERGRFYTALQEFGHSVGHPPLRLSSLTLSGRAAYQAGHFQDAVGLLTQATELNPHSLEALRWLASAYYDLGLNDDAVATLTQIAELDPRDPRPHRVMGMMYKDFENYPVAVKHYRESLRRDPRQPDHDKMVLELADCEINLRQFDSALATLSECGPQADRWAREAECLHGLSRLDEARGRVAQTLDHDPAHLTGLLLAGTMAAERNDTAGAVGWFSRAVVAHPKDYTARFRLAQAYRRSGNIAEADEHTRVAEEIKRVREEFSRLHGTAAAEPGNANVRCRLGVLARELGRPDLARTWFRAALAIDPGHAETLRNLAGEPPHKAQK